MAARVRLLIITALLASCVPASAAASAERPGQINFLQNATSRFDGYVAGASASEQAWMREHYWRMRGYPDFYDQALDWAPPSQYYHDLYALYRDSTEDQNVVAQHPDWVLRNSGGQRLYIPSDCDGQSCAQYAADIGNPGFREWWIAKARAQIAKGYTGLFIDDVNIDMSVSNASGTEVVPIDPRTGRPMAESDWRRYLAEFVEQIRAALPGAEIVHNAHWWISHSDPYYQRSIDAADTIELERGFNDPGLTRGGGTYGFETFLEHVEWLHSRGKSVILEPYNLTTAKAEFEMASLYLVKEGEDAIASSFQSDPHNWWQGWETDLGAPLGGRYEWQGLFRRDFERGFVLVNQPDAPETRVELDAPYRRLSGQTVTQVSLGASSGAILLGATQREETQTDLAADPGQGSVGVEVEVVDPDTGRARIAVERRSDGRWRRIRGRTGRVEAGGLLARFGDLKRGAYRASARYLGSADHLASRSGMRRFRIKRA